MQFTCTHLLDAHLWDNDGPFRRSLELSPLYVNRFAGPHSGRCPTKHEHWELIWIFSGNGELLGNRGRRLGKLATGTLCSVPPNTAHIEHSSAKMDLLWIGLQGTVLEECAAYPSIEMRAAPEAVGLCQQLSDMARREYGLIGVQLDGLCRTLWGMAQATENIKSMTNNHPVARAVAYLHNNFQRSIQVPELARICGCSSGYLYRLFKKETGMTPVAYLTRIRVRQAVRWLEQTDLTVMRVAALTGFDDYHYFSRVFRRVTGFSPSQIRRRE